MMTPPTYPMRPLNGGPLDSPANVMRYNPPPVEGVEAMRVDAWRFEPKLNGWRATVNDRYRSMFNRHNQPLSIGTEFAAALDKLMDAGDVCPWWDCEALERRHNIGKGSLILLDWIDVRGARYPLRRKMVEAWGQPFDWQMPLLEANTLYTIPSFDYDTALKFWAQAPIINEILGCTFYEGVVAKRVTSEYKVQLRSDEEQTVDWVKHRFTTAA